MVLLVPWNKDESSVLFKKLFPFICKSFNIVFLVLITNSLKPWNILDWYIVSNRIGDLLITYRDRKIQWLKAQKQRSFLRSTMLSIFQDYSTLMRIFCFYFVSEAPKFRNLFFFFFQLFLRTLLRSATATWFFVWPSKMMTPCKISAS